MRGEKIEVWKPIRRTILPIFPAVHITLAISFFMSSQLSGNIIRSADQLYVYVCLS